MTTDDAVVDVSQDWVLACDVQQRFMHGPGWNTGSVDLSGRCRQVRALGGDCYHFMPLTEDRLALVVGDASGKGLAAAVGGLPGWRRGGECGRAGGGADGARRSAAEDLPHRSDRPLRRGRDHAAHRRHA